MIGMEWILCEKFTNICMKSHIKVVKHMKKYAYKKTQ